MSGFPGTPRLVRGGIVIADPSTLAVQSVIALQYNPDTLTRTLQVQGATASGNHSEALRLTGPAIETLKLDAEFDATDGLANPDQNPTLVEVGLHAQLARLEALVNPSVAHLQGLDRLAAQGAIEVAAAQAPLTLFVWSAQRILPVRITDFSVVEDAFDVHLNPIRARVSLGLRVLSVDDLGYQHPGGALFLGQLQRMESLAQRASGAALASLGIGRLG